MGFSDPVRPLRTQDTTIRRQLYASLAQQNFAVPALVTMMLSIPYPFNLRGQSGGDYGV